MKANRWQDEGCSGMLRNAEHKSITVYLLESQTVKLMGLEPVGLQLGQPHYFAHRSCTNLHFSECSFLTGKIGVLQGLVLSSNTPAVISP